MAGLLLDVPVAVRRTPGFQGRPSLSKGYQIISRFSEDVDLTYDIRVLAPDLSGPGLDPLPAMRSP